MKKVNNIIKCSKCGVSLIDEELKFHQCHSLKPSGFIADTDYDYFEIFDGIRWIKMKNRQPMGNTKKSTDNETEPN